MKQKLLLLIMLLLSVTMDAYDCYVDGIYYNVIKKAKQAIVTYRDQNTWGGATFYRGDVVIPATIEYEGVVCDVIAIGENAFNECYGLTSVSIPHSVKTIKSGAFDGSHWKPHLTALYISNISSWLNMEISSNPLAISDHLYVNGVEVADLKIPAGITKIPANSFSGATMLKSVVVPEGCTFIGANAFSGCTGLASISIPESVTEFGCCAFQNCTALTDVKLPSSITTITSGLFYQSGLTSISIPNNVTELGDAAFRYCENLKSIYFGTGLNKSGITVFDGCVNLENVYISDLTAWIQTDFVHPFSGDIGSSSVVHRAGGSNPLLYAQHLYLNGEEIKDLVIPEGITNVPIGAFPGFSGITSVIIPNSVETCSFRGCANMKSIKVGNGLKDFSVYDCENLLSVSLGSGLSKVNISKCDKLETLVLGKRTQSCDVRECKELSDVYCSSIIPPHAEFSEDCMIGYVTLHINEEALESYRATTPWSNFGTIAVLEKEDPGYEEQIDSKIYFTDNEVWRICIENWDSNGDKELSKDEAANVTNLGIVFKSNKNVKCFDELKYFTALTSIPEGAFSGCENMSSIILPEKIETIERKSFYNCKSLEAITIPATVSSISDEAFSGCERIKSVILSDQLSQIGQNAFYHCKSLESIAFSNSLQSIGESAFSGCSALKVLTLPEGIERIEQYTFASCTNLEKVTIPNSVKEVKSFAFYYSKVKELIIGKGIQYFGGYNFSEIEKIHISDLKVWSKIEFERAEYNPIDKAKQCFISDDLIEEAVIPLSISKINDYEFGGWVFDNCPRLTTVVIPEDLNVIGSFSGCPNLKDIYCYNITPLFIYDDCFPSFTATLHVPKESIYTYKETSGWKNFANIVALKANDPIDDVFPDETLDLNDGDLFTVNTLRGFGIKFRVLSSEDRTCQVDGDGNNKSALFKRRDGKLTIPAIAMGYKVTQIGDYALYDSRSLTKIVLPNSVKSIGSGAFSYCRGLTSFIIPEGVNSIGSSAFSGCSGLQYVVIPPTMESILIAAFDKCTSLTDIYCPSRKVPGGGSSISNPEKMTLHVPSASVGDYNNTVGWKDFGSIVALKDGDPGYSEDLDDEDDEIPEPYAALSDDNKKLTFYYDEKKSSRNGMSVGPFLYNNGVDSEWYGQRESITSVVFDASFANYSELTSTAYWFYGCTNLKDVNGLEKLNVSNVTTMKFMFYECSSLTSLDVSQFNTANVTDMGNMFNGCKSLINLDVNQFNTDNVTSMNCMFAACSSLTSLDVSQFNTANVTNLWAMFSGCSSLTSLDVSNFNTACATSIGAMFSYCSSLTSLDVSNFNTANVTNMDIMFSGCSSLTTIYCNDVWNCSSSSLMFSGCTSLNGAISYDSNKTDVTYANPTTGYFTSKETNPEIIKFADSKVKEICLKYWDTNEDGEFSMTEAASVLWIGNAFAESEITTFNEFSYFTAVTDIDDAAFRKCKNLKEITLPNSATSIGKQTFAYCQNLAKVVMPNSMTSIGDYAFIGCNNLANIEFSDKLTKIGDGAFENCSSLSTINIPASVFYIGGSPFDSCSGLMTINVNSGNMRYCSVDGVLFDKTCTKLVQYPIGKEGNEYVIPSTVVTIGEGAFISSTNLHTITIPESVMTIELGAFMDCTSLEMITIPQSVTSLAKYSFYGCSGLKSVTSIATNPFEIESNVFEISKNTFTTATLYVPAGSISKYQTVGGWKNFKKFMPIGDVNGDSSINDADTKEEVDYIMGNPSKTYVKAAGDMNGDGVINVVDIVLMNAIKAK